MVADAVFDELIAGLNDKSAKVRRSAAEALGELEEVRAVEPLARFVRIRTSVPVSPALIM